MALVDPKDLITPMTAAEQVGCSRTYIYRIIRDGKLDTVMIDGVTFVRRGDVNVLEQLHKNARKKSKL